MTILLSRFLPLLRTFAPFVAGVGRMHYLSFQGYNILGGFAWGSVFIWGGYLFGNIPLVKHNFGLVTIFIVLVSLLPKIGPYVLSFVILAIRWRELLGDRVTDLQVGKAYVNWMLANLLLVTFVPFSTLLIGRYASLAPAVCWH